MDNYETTVVTTLCNYRKYIVDAIESFLKQDFTASDMVIVDDASTDNPYKVIKPFVSDRIKYIRLEKNGGYSRAKNIGIENARAEVLVMLDADDMLTPTGISSRYKRICEGYNLVHGPVLDWKKGEVTGRSRMWGNWLANHDHSNIHAQSVMLRKQIHREIGLYDESMWCKSDREMFARIFNRGYRIGYVETDVAIYRHHSLQMHRSSQKMAANNRLTKELHKKIESRKTDLSGIRLLV